MDYRSKSRTLIAILRSVGNLILLSLSWFLRYKYLLPILLAFVLWSDVKPASLRFQEKLTLHPTPEKPHRLLRRICVPEKLHADP